MLVDGAVPTRLSDVPAAVANSEAAGYDGVWSAETGHDPFLPLVLAAEHSQRIGIGTAIAVAFARNPMDLATMANDLQAYSSGRFMLGLGSQIKAHIEKRYSMPWSHPAARMRELILAMRAIWDCWNNGTKLDFRGDFYTHTLMTPFFSPGPNPHGAPKVFLAAVGERMAEVAGEVAEGILIHGFTTERYLRDVTLPAVQRGLDRAGRSRSEFQVSYPGFVVTGDSAESMEQAADAVRRQIAFYGSTPAYRGVLEIHGWGELQTELNTLSKQGKWVEMGTLIDDDVLNAFAVVGEPDRVPAELRRRYADIVDRLSFYAPYQRDPARWSETVAALKGAA
ncbi:MAG TPA: LLM class F420-dependent oxidoreductase [Acidimicrobiales bacterium]|nr:LLM class F420-dependent oxidoreductase [Acidimicrobiales bacterium]